MDTTVQGGLIYTADGVPHDSCDDFSTPGTYRRRTGDDLLRLPRAQRVPLPLLPRAVYEVKTPRPEDFYTSSRHSERSRFRCNPSSKPVSALACGQSILSSLPTSYSPSVALSLSLLTPEKTRGHSRHCGFARSYSRSRLPTPATRSRIGARQPVRRSCEGEGEGGRGGREGVVSASQADGNNPAESAQVFGLTAEDTRRRSGRARRHVARGGSSSLATVSATASSRFRTHAPAADGEQRGDAT